MTRDELNARYCIDMTAVEARAILQGSVRGDKKKAEKEMNRLYSEWVVHFKTKDGRPYSMKITGVSSENEAFKKAVQFAVRQGNGGVIDKSAPLKIQFNKNWV